MNNCDKLLDLLYRSHPNYSCELNYSNNFELLVAVILSAQCTDKRVNLVTHDLFNEYNSPEKIIELGYDGLCKFIKSCGLYQSKAKNIISMCNDLVVKFNGEVPSDFNELISLSGVGRKTANVVRAVGFGIPSIAVDTHVFRLSHRLGLSKGKTPFDVENDLMKTFNKESWSDLHHLLIHHGRYVCTAKNPKCNECLLKEFCLEKRKNV